MEPDALAGRLAGCVGWSGPEEIGDTAALLRSRWQRTPRGDRTRFVAQLTRLLA